jgi:hypothetical protein
MEAVKTTVTMTRQVEVHAHNFDVVTTLGDGDNSAPRRTLVCLCGNGFSVQASSTYVYGKWAENRISLSKLLEMAAEEQDKRHKDWRSDE